MGSVFTNTGQTRINEVIGNASTLVIDRMVLALVPGLDPDAAIDRSQQMPDPADIVHTYTIDEDHKGYISPDQVVYSMLLGADIGDFTFNWIGLVEAVTDTVIAITTTPDISKWASDLATNTTGNAITRNMMLSFQDAQNVTGITITASTWQFDFSAEFNTHVNMQLDPTDADTVKNRHLSNAQGKKWEDHVGDEVLHVSFPTGTVMLFAQATTPVGWTKKADWENVAALHVGNDYATGGASSPRSYTTEISIASHVNHVHSGPNHRHTGPSHSHGITVAGHALTISQIPSHKHSMDDVYIYSWNGDAASNSMGGPSGPITRDTGSVGGGSTHAHAASSADSGTQNTGYGGTGETGGAGAASHAVTQSTYLPRFVQVIAAIKD
ncbi:MAG: phage tail protein [Desulfotignum sp.]|nr:phage tail protein [Desulfotignum sp.]